MDPLQLLHDLSSGSVYDLPERLRVLYGGELRFDEPCLYANLVSTIDGVVALEPPVDSSGVISRRSAADRFVMGVLRACADAVLIGSRTLRSAPKHVWTAERVFPAEAEAYGELRAHHGRAPGPELAIVTGSGKVDPSHPAVQAGAVVLTTNDGAARLRALPESTEVIALGSGERLSSHSIVDALRARGHRMVLTEGGPMLFGQLLADRLVDALFLTVSPVISGRDEGSDRPGLVRGVKFSSNDLRDAGLVTVHRHGSHLFLRYALR